ncbi:MAG TPA: hypothetical protein VMV18_08205, partial [bacterium]|nr:hypothetical protein [bacterium]
AACSRHGHGGAPIPPIAQCDAGLTSFVRNANLAILGRRPLGEAEVAHYVGYGLDSPARRQAIVDEMMNQPEFVDRWREVFEDMLRVPRVDDQAMNSCYGLRARNPDGGDLGRFVASHDPTADAGGAFTMLDLLDSSLRADDLSPVYRAHLFAMVAFPIPAANVPQVQAELARRQDYGNVFDAAYLNRDLVCLNCHNSEFSVTYDSDPAKNRHWPLPGHFEKALYGASTGEDPNVAHAMFRFDGFVGDPQFDPGQPAWGWLSACGQFHADVSGQDDPADIDAKFGNITGKRVSVFDLEKSLRAGVESLAATGLQTAPDGTISDPDQAFAYLVGASISEGVWREVIGSGLTIANYFPRNEASRDELATLTNDLVASKFSLRRLLHDVVQSPYFNQLPPSAGCTATAYSYPNVWDPWVIGDSDPAKRKNSSADGVSALPARVLMRASYDALNWPLPDDKGFPTSDAQVDFYRGVGLFLKNSERGFRGLDFQARLVWEDRVAACANQSGSSDAVDVIVQKAGSTSGATVRDVVVALKDRLLGETTVDDSTPAGAAERAAVEALYGTSLDSPASSAADLAGSTRKLCGVYLSTPQFLLSGFANPKVEAPPALAP